jgi:hypothetical protein
MHITVFPNASTHFWYTSINSHHCTKRKTAAPSEGFLKLIWSMHPRLYPGQEMMLPMYGSLSQYEMKAISSSQRHFIHNADMRVPNFICLLLCPSRLCSELRISRVPEQGFLHDLWTPLDVQATLTSQSIILECLWAKQPCYRDRMARGVALGLTSRAKGLQPKAGSMCHWPIALNI